jgi:hypothetical protein
MSRILLHIGHPKTGTTALQSVLSKNSKILLDNASTLYPTHTTPQEYKHAIAIPWLFKADNAPIRRRTHAYGTKLERISRQYWDSLVKEVNNTKHERLILSAEGFWTILRRCSKSQAIDFRSKLYETGSDVQVIAYLKSPAPYFLSRINQKLRNFKPVTLPRTNYLSAAIKGWEGLGFNHYSWRVFERNNLINHDIVDDFCANYLPTTFDTSLLDRVGAEKANSSVSNEALVIIEEATKTYPFLCHEVYDRRRAKIVSILRNADQEIGGNLRPSLKESARNEIIGRCDDLHWLQERGITFRDIDYGSLRHSAPENISEEFTCVADFCPVDSERLANLKSVVETQIHQLFKVKTKHLFWPFRQIEKR